MAKSYAEMEREKNPLLYEKVRVIVDATNALKLAIEELGGSGTPGTTNLPEEWTLETLLSYLNANAEDTDSDIPLSELASFAFYVGKRVEIRLVDLDDKKRSA